MVPNMFSAYYSRGCDSEKMFLNERDVLIRDEAMAQVYFEFLKNKDTVATKLRRSGRDEMVEYSSWGV